MARRDHGHARLRGLLELLGRHTGRVRRPQMWQEAIFILVSYYLYSLVRNVVHADKSIAVQHAHDVLNAESSLGINIELAVNHFFDRIVPLAVAADYYYATLQFVVTIGVLVWVFAKHPLQYRRVRTVLYVSTLLATLGFWLYPLAPPRLIGGGFVDTLLKYHTWGSLASGSVEKVSNQYAAMPSLHVGWALWCGLTIAVLAGRVWVKALGALYPVLTTLVVIGTANHYVFDAAAGVAVIGLGFAVQRLISGQPAYALLDSSGHRIKRHPGSEDLSASDAASGTPGADEAPDAPAVVAAADAPPPAGRGEEPGPDAPLTVRLPDSSPLTGHTPNHGHPLAPHQSSGAQANGRRRRVGPVNAGDRPPNRD